MKTHLIIICLLVVFSSSGALLDPISQLLTWFQNCLTGAGRVVIDGDSTSNEGPLDVPSTLIQPPIAHAQYYAYFIAAAYCFANSLQTWSCPFCIKISNQADNVTFNRILQNASYDTFGYVAVDNNNESIVVVLRGSFNVQNFAADFDILLIPWENSTSIKVHKGFYESMMSLYDQITTALNTLITTYPGYKVVVAGHSLGGSMGSMLTLKLMYNNVYPQITYELFTYGEPRGGNRAYANAHNSLGIVTARVVEYADVVPHTSPAILTYYHRQNELWIFNKTTNSAKYCNQTVYEDPNCSNSLGPNYIPTDHLVYMEQHVLQCAWMDPWNFFLNLLNPLSYYIFPPSIMFQFPLGLIYQNPFLPSLPLPG